MAKVFVTDASDRICLAIARSLGEKGIEVTVGDSTSVCLSRFSKYCKRFVLYPSPKEYPQQFLEWLRNHLKKNQYDVLFPVDDIPLLIISKNKEELSQFCKIPIADFETIMKARNKRKTIEIAMKHNIPCPKTYFIENINEVKELSKKIDFPVVIKPQESSGARGIIYVKSPGDLVSSYLRVHQFYRYPLIQEYIPTIKPRCCISAIFNVCSEPRAVFIQKTLRQYGGVDTFSVGINSNLKNIGIKLLKSLNWYGVAHVELLIDSRDEKIKLMEVNPRFWSSLQLAVSSGVDFPYLLYKMAVEDDIEPLTKYKTGVRFRWILPGDILCFLSNLRRGKKTPRFFNGNTAKAILSLDDPKPSLVFIVTLLSYLFNREKHKHGFPRM